MTAMAYDMDRLLKQEMLTVTPRTGTFDVNALSAGLLGIGYPFVDDMHPSRVLICSDAAARDHFQAARRADPSLAYPRVVNVDVRADRVLVWPASYHPALRDVSLEVLRWLTSTYDCDIVNEVDADMSVPLVTG